MSNARGASTAAVTLPPIEVGTRLTDFATLDLTVQGKASGGMGLVAWGPNAAQGGQMRAVKLIRPDLLAGRSEHERARLHADFEREALTWCHVWPHATIIRVGMLTRLPGWDHLPVLTLEYAPQGNLRTLLSRSHQPGTHLALKMAFAWAQQIAAGLAAIHMPDPDHERPQPLVHCDLKPENVLLNAHGWALLTDLGLTRAYAEAGAAVAPPASSADGPAGAGEAGMDERQARIASWRAALIQAGLRSPDPDPADPITGPDPVAEATAHATLAAAALGTRSVRVPPLPAARAVGSRGPVAGTPHYMAPEQWLGLDAVGPATDVYALGVLLFELFAGVNALPITPDLSRAVTEQDVLLAWYEAHRQGLRLTLSNPAVAALAGGPLNDLVVDAAGAERAREALDGLERLVAACLAGQAERRPTAEQVRARLAALAERAGLAPTDIPEVAPHTATNEADFWINLGSTAGSLGQREEQLRLYRRGVKLDPGDPLNWLNLGAAHHEVGQPEETLAAYQEAERRATSEWVARYPYLHTMLSSNQGSVLTVLRRYTEAVAAFQRALALAPDMADTRYNLALAYSDWAEEAGARGELARRDELLRLAQGELLRAIAIQPGFTQAREVLALVEEQLRRG
jgi:serine/threonine protein kinase